MKDLITYTNKNIIKVLSDVITFLVIIHILKAKEL